MKNLYQAPEAEVVNFTALENMAAIETKSDIVELSSEVVDRPR